MIEAKRGNSPLTVEKALKVLEEFADAGVPLRISELSDRVSINKSTCYRLLQALSTRGYVTQDLDSSKYRLGYKILEISNAMLKSIGLRTVARPHLEQLARETSLTVGLAVRNEWEMVYVDQVDGPGVIRLELRVGSRWPMHCTAAGKAFLAFLREEEIEDFLSLRNLQKHTRNTIGGAKRLIRELRTIRVRGYAFNNAEYQKEVKAVGSPVFRTKREVIGSVVAAGPADNIIRGAVESLGKKVRHAARIISEAIGYVEE